MAVIVDAEGCGTVQPRRLQAASVHKAESVSLHTQAHALSRPTMSLCPASLLDAWEKGVVVRASSWTRKVRLCIWPWPAHADLCIHLQDEVVLCLSAAKDKVDDAIHPQLADVLQALGADVLAQLHREVVGYLCLVLVSKHL